MTGELITTSEADGYFILHDNKGVLECRECGYLTNQYRSTDAYAHVEQAHDSVVLREIEYFEKFYQDQFWEVYFEEEVSRESLLSVMVQSIMSARFFE